jgi:anaerobic ribonucleoside-triphosphate reductase activating protein
MNYHNILHDDMRNGDGLRVTIFVSGCNHYCKNCQNPQTWDCNSGIEFDLAAKEEIFEQLNKEYINGITFTGGDPLYDGNLEDVLDLIYEIKNKFSDKTIWLYTGYTWEEIMYSRMPHPPHYTSEDFLHWNQRKEVVSKIDILVDGEYKDNEKDIKLPYRGSSNQRLIDCKKSLEKGEVVLWQNN